MSRKLFCLFAILIFQPVMPEANAQATKAFSGEWKVELVEYEGTNCVDPKNPIFLDNLIYEVAGEKLSVRSARGVITQANLVINSTRFPKTIDLVFTDRTLQGIYLIDDSFVVVCLQHDHTKSRPSTFNTIRQPGATLYLLRRKQ